MTRIFYLQVPNYFTRHKAIPAKPFLAASCTSMISVGSVRTKITSAGCKGWTKRTDRPEANALISVGDMLTFLPGFRIIEISLITGELFLYFKSTHKRRVAILSGVTSTGTLSGPLVEPFCTADKKPSL